MSPPGLRFRSGRGTPAALAAIDGGAVADTHVMAVMRMSDGILISFHEGFDVPFAEPAIEIHGELATATCVGHTAQHGAGRLWLTRDHGRSPQHIDVGPLTDPYAE